jgi:hypothetical protein
MIDPRADEQWPFFAQELFALRPYLLWQKLHDDLFVGANFFVFVLDPSLFLSSTFFSSKVVVGERLLALWRKYHRMTPYVVSRIPSFKKLARFSFCFVSFIPSINPEESSVVRQLELSTLVASASASHPTAASDKNRSGCHTQFE